MHRYATRWTNPGEPHSPGNSPKTSTTDLRAAREITSFPSCAHTVNLSTRARREPLNFESRFATYSSEFYLPGTVPCPNYH